MSSFQVRCPQCSLLLGAVGSGQVNIRCAACGTVFGVQIAQPLGAFAPPPPPPPPQPFASFQAVPTPTAVQNLCALGFPEAQARDALRSSDGDVERAATLLLATPRETSHAASPRHAASATEISDWLSAFLGQSRHTGPISVNNTRLLVCKCLKCPSAPRLPTCRPSDLCAGAVSSLTLARLPRFPYLPPCSTSFPVRLILPPCSACCAYTGIPNTSISR